MNKNILAFLIPLITLVVIAFTPILDPIVSNIKFKINNTFEKMNILLSDTNKTANKMNLDFISDTDFYKSEIKKNIINVDARIHFLNYIYYLNERNKASASKDVLMEKKESLANIFKYDYFMKVEYQKILDLIGDNKFNPIKIYTGRSERNKNLSKFSYEIIEMNKDKYKLEFLIGDDINYTASDKLVF